jgi:hypothetical protein
MKIIRVLLLGFAIVILPMIAMGADSGEGIVAEEETTFVDSRRAAQAIGVEMPESLTGHYYWSDDVTGSFHWARYEIQHRELVYLEVDGEVLISFDDPPAPGFPPVEGGMSQFELYLNAWDAWGMVLGFGNFSAARLFPEEVINITLKPADRYEIIRIPPAALKDPSAIAYFEGDDGSSFRIRFGGNSTGYVGVYLSPTVRYSVSFESSLTGEVYGVGEIDPLKDEDRSVQAEHYLNMSWVGGVRQIRLDDSVYLPGQGLRGGIEECDDDGCIRQPAAHYNIALKKESGSTIDVFPRSWNGALRVKAFMWRVRGEMPLIADSGKGAPGWGAHLSIPPGYEAVTVEVISEGGSASDMFDVHLGLSIK